ncbi:MAG: DUF933 domain-containing protein [Betaproteobacteria bacterium]|nr:DUF933 domain-containing protein [Betaproteobacteria bacterium]
MSTQRRCLCFFASERLRPEGKEYVVKDGDAMRFRFNV